MADSPRIGLISYTNLTSGIGVFAWELIKYLGVDSVLSVKNRVKGQEEWIDRQHTAGETVREGTVRHYLDRYKPDVVLFFETPFGDGLQKVRSERKSLRVVGIPMQETMGAKDFSWCDAIICPCSSALTKARSVKRAYGLFLPIGLEMFPFAQRKGHTFVHNVGYGWRTDRRQTRTVVEAFKMLKDPDARLIINAQQKFPAGGVMPDPRIDYNLESYKSPSDIFARGDISVLPIAYGGYERMILESMASGLPTLTTNADPMCMFQHDPSFLITPWKRKTVTSPFLYRVVFNEISVGSMHRHMTRLLSIDTAAHSKAARKQAEAQSWESKDIDYKGEWMRVLREVCSC